VEAAGVWVFAGYWLVKSRELRNTGAAHLALQGKLSRIANPRRGQLGAVIQVEPDVIQVEDWKNVVGASG
jgi:hypothetical protein